MVRFTRTVAGTELTVVTHNRPHLDEIAALWMAENFATLEWVAQWCPDAELKLGVEGSPFDEHPREETPAQREECCATLMAKSLGQDGNPALAQLLRFIYNVDARGAGHPYDLYNCVKQMNEVYPDDPLRVVEWTYEALRAKYREQNEFLASRIAVREARTIRLNDEGLLLVVVEGDRGMVAKAASELYGKQYGACIALRSDGHVQVFTNKNAHIRLHEVTRLLRIAEFRHEAERRRRTASVPHSDTDLRAPGMLGIAPQWYYHENGEQLLNGSLTAGDVPPTPLPTELIVDCVRLGILRTLPKPKSVAEVPPLRV